LHVEAAEQEDVGVARADQRVLHDERCDVRIAVGMQASSKLVADDL
jgi:hypothetical protein